MTRKARPSPLAMAPQGPVLTPGARWARFGIPAVRSFSASSTEGLPHDEPLLPALPFGLSYELDLVFMTQHPAWSMHEYALLATSRGPVWLCKDAREGTLVQTIVADLPDIDGWLPEVPVARRSAPVAVEQRIDARRVVVELAYTNWDGEAVQVRYDGAFPNTPRGRRNGSTMGHSRAALLALLDLSHQDLGWRGAVTIGGVQQRPATILGVPVRAALLQTQGGVGTGRFRQEGGALAIATAAGTAHRATTLAAQGDGLVLLQQDAERALGAEFGPDGGGGLGLRRLFVRQHGRAGEAVGITLNPPLPDLRRAFAGALTSDFVIDVGGQRSHAVGTATARWTADGPEVELRPAAPWWAWDRPLRSRLRPAPGGVDVVVERIRPELPLPRGARHVGPDPAFAGEIAPPIE